MSVLLNQIESKNKGIASYCTSNPFVLRYLLRIYRKLDLPLLIEATANQVNQFGGYSGMTPDLFSDYVKSLACEEKFSLSNLILGGDHLGPLVWVNEEQEVAMEKAISLVSAFVQAGFQKIHLDTSMKLRGDAESFYDSPQLVVKRGKILAQACEQIAKTKMGSSPIYVIGSEVPVPGGETNSESNDVKVTNSENLEKTLLAYAESFEDLNIWNRVKAVVVQPGVEFGNDGIVTYRPENFQNLKEIIRKYPGMVFEGHSTDYQSSKTLSNMVADGIAILKVGPALTHAFINALFNLELLLDDLTSRGKKFTTALQGCMQAQPKYWQAYVPQISSLTIRDCYKKYSLSDRARYYLGDPTVLKEIEEMFSVFAKVNVPVFMVDRYFPRQFRLILQGDLDFNLDSILEDEIKQVVIPYVYATTGIEL